MYCIPRVQPIGHKTRTPSMASILLTTDQAQAAAQGEMAVYTHTLTNEGAQIDTFSLSASSDQGWTTS